MGSNHVKRAILAEAVGALLVVLGYLSVAAGSDGGVTANVTGNGFILVLCTAVTGAITHLIVRWRVIPPAAVDQPASSLTAIREQLAKGTTGRATGPRVGPPTVGLLLVAALGLGAVGPRCNGLSRYTADAILQTAEAGLGIVDAWCRPDVTGADDELCRSIRTWSAVGVHVLGLVLPGFVAAEMGDEAADDEAQPARVVPISCLDAMARCEAAKGPADVCGVVQAGCTGAGAQIVIAPMVSTP